MVVIITMVTMVIKVPAAPRPCVSTAVAAVLLHEGSCHVGTRDSAAYNPYITLI